MLVVSVKAQYEKLFTSGPAFVNFPYPTIPLNCSEIGPSGSPLGVDHMEEGAGFFPALEWPSPAKIIREYLLVAEDPDGPLPHSVIHGVYYGIPRVFTGLQHGDFQVSRTHNDSYMLEGGFKYGKNRRNTVYLPPKSIPEDGPHRYFFRAHCSECTDRPKQAKRQGDPEGDCRCHLRQGCRMGCLGGHCQQ